MQKIDVSAEEQENLIVDALEDTSNILKAMKISPKRIHYYAAAPWKWQVYLRVLEKSLVGEAKMTELMKEFSQDPVLKPHMKDIAALVPRIIKALTKLSNERKTNILKTKMTNEKEILDSALDFLKGRFNSEVSVYCEEDPRRFDPKNRATMALPHQPAIYIE